MDRMLFSGIRDNKERGSAGGFLVQNLTTETLLSVVSAYFTINAYGELKDKLEQLAGFRFLYGDPKFVGRIQQLGNDAKAFELTERRLSLSKQLAQRALAVECARWIREKTEVRSVREGFLHGKMYHARQGNRDQALLGSSNFTIPGLGFGSNPNVELNLVVDGDRDRADLLAWFDEWWHDDERTLDVKENVLAHLDRLYRNQSPQFIYYLTLFHLFGDLLDAQQDANDALTSVELPDTEIWQALFEFQQDGAKAIIRKLKDLNGCILADSVGLGKTYTALAVIKLFELKNERVLVLCPKKLRLNWTLYRNNSVTNPFVKDRFRYDVLSHTDLSRSTGQADGTDLSTINWGNYDLVVIDESHNFRNNNRAKLVDGEPHRKTRYQKLMQDIVQSGINTKVLLLSATPVNNELGDLRNQISFIAGGDVTSDVKADAAFHERLGLRSIRSTTEQAQRQFKSWAGRPTTERSREELLEVLDGDFFKLLDGVSIARSRAQISRHYEREVEKLGGFPQRAKPVSLTPPVDIQNEAFSFHSIDAKIRSLTLAQYNPAGYLRDNLSRKVRDEYHREVVNGFTQAGREKILIGMMKINLMKRLESSVDSFRLTIERTLAKIESLFKRMEAFQAHQELNPEIDYTQISLENLDDPELEDREFAIGGKRRFHLGHIDTDKWRALLESDKKVLTSLLNVAKLVTPERDGKLTELWNRISEKLNSPTRNRKGRDNRKVLVFTAFADTAEYLFKNLRERAEQAGVHIALVRGDGGNQTTLGRKDYDSILTNFSPESKLRAKRLDSPPTEEIDVLIATDCISEGQNLQDCDIVVNYDIHWNPVRIIQRFGRIDRIGSQNAIVHLVNFWPVGDLESYLGVQSRVEARMALVDITATQGDNLLEDTQFEDLVKQDLRFRDQQLRRLKNEVVDLEEMDEGVSLVEFSLDEFRTDLLRFLESHRAAFEAADLGLFAVVPSDRENSLAQPGALFCLRHVQPDSEGPSSKKRSESKINPLGPHYLIYVRDSGEVRLGFTSPKRSLELFRDLAAGHEKAFDDLCALFDDQTSNGEDMAHYETLIQAATESVIRSVQSKVSGQIINPDGLIPKAREVPTESDSEFELLTWLVLINNRSSKNV